MTRKQMIERLRITFADGFTTPDGKCRAVDILDVGQSGFVISITLIDLDLNVKAFIPDSQRVGIRWHRGFYTERDFTFAEHRTLAAISDQLVNLIEQATHEN